MRKLQCRNIWRSNVMMSWCCLFACQRRTSLVSQEPPGFTVWFSVWVCSGCSPIYQCSAQCLAQCSAGLEPSTPHTPHTPSAARSFLSSSSFCIRSVNPLLVKCFVTLDTLMSNISRTQFLHAPCLYCNKYTIPPVLHMMRGTLGVRWWKFLYGWPFLAIGTHEI